MSIESGLSGKTEYSDPIEQMAADGWICLGRESLTTTKFSPEAKFDQAPLQTEESIKIRYLQDLHQDYPDQKFEVTLVLDESTEKLKRLREIAEPGEYQQILSNLEDQDKSFIVFVRQIKK